MLKVLSSVNKLIQFSSQEAIARLLLVSSWFVYSSKNLICLEVLSFYDSKSIGFLSSFLRLEKKYWRSVFFNQCCSIKFEGVVFEVSIESLQVFFGSSI